MQRVDASRAAGGEDRVSAARSPPRAPRAVADADAYARSDASARTPAERTTVAFEASAAASAAGCAEETDDATRAMPTATSLPPITPKGGGARPAPAPRASTRPRAEGSDEEKDAATFGGRNLTVMTR